MSLLLHVVIYALHLLSTYIEASPLCTLAPDELAPEVGNTSWPVSNVTAGSRESRYTINPYKRKASHTDDFKASLLNRPKALLYTGINFTGLEESYNFGGVPGSKDYTGSCYTPKRYYAPWQSIRAIGSCVRLFNIYNCDGTSVAIYPGTTGNISSGFSNHRIFSWANSVGPCFSDEFKFASFSRTNAGLTVTKDLLNPYQVIDVLLSIDYNSKYSTFEALYYSTSHIGYVMKEGLNNRTKNIYILFDQRSVGIAATPYQTTVKNKNLKWKLFERKAGDDLGFIIPPKLGGPADAIYNILPQSRGNKQKWTQITNQIFVSLASRSYRQSYETLEVTLYYENETTKRPFGFCYRYEIFVPGRGRITEYDFLYNLK